MSAPAVALGIPSRTLGSLGLPAVRGQEDDVARVTSLPLTDEAVAAFRHVRHLGVTDELAEVCRYFKTPAGHLPAGFRVQLVAGPDGLVQADLVRDIGYDADGMKRPTRVLYSADTANPYELAPVAPFVANLTCNPGIIYDLFINNPKANVDHRFSTRDEVMAEIGRVLGPGCDISVELNNPFDPDVNKLIEEAEQFREILSRWRVVIKVPHTGPVNADNVEQLFEGDKRLSTRWFEAATKDAFLGHNLALTLREHGFRVNFTLMFDPHQAQLALQARPAYINAFVRHRLLQTRKLADLLARDRDGDEGALTELRDYLVSIDQLGSGDGGFDVEQAKAKAEFLVKYRQIDTPEGADGLDCVRHNLRLLRQSNLPDTRLIICSVEGDAMYPDIDKMLTEPEFADMTDRVVVTAEPGYLARFASSGQVISYQRRFLQAARGQH